MSPTDIADILAAISGLREEVAALRGLREEVAALRSVTEEFRAEQLAFQDHVAKHFERVYSRLGSVEGRLGSLEAELSRQGTRLDAMQCDFKAFGERFDGVDHRFAELREDLTEQIHDLRGFMSDGFRDWGRRVTALEERMDQRSNTP